MLYWWVGRWWYQVSPITKKDWQHLYTDTERPGLTSQPRFCFKLFLWRLSHPFWTVSSAPTHFPIRLTLGANPERAPRFYGAFVFSVYPLPKCWPTATAKRAPETTSVRAAAEQRDVLTFHPELQLDLEQKQKYSHVYFFPRNDNYRTPNFNYQNGKGITKK